MGAAGLALRRLQWVWRRSPRPIGQRRHGRRHGRSLRWQRDRVAGRSEGCILPTAGWVHHLERQWRAPSAQRRRERAGERGVGWNRTDDGRCADEWGRLSSKGVLQCPTRIVAYNPIVTMAVDRPCGPSEYLVSSGALSSEATVPHLSEYLDSVGRQLASCTCAQPQARIKNKVNATRHRPARSRATRFVRLRQCSIARNM